MRSNSSPQRFIFTGNYLTYSIIIEVQQCLQSRDHLLTLAIFISLTRLFLIKYAIIYDVRKLVNKTLQSHNSFERKSNAYDDKLNAAKSFSPPIKMIKFFLHSLQAYSAFFLRFFFFFDFTTTFSSISGFTSSKSM